MGRRKTISPDTSEKARQFIREWLGGEIETKADVLPVSWVVSGNLHRSNPGLRDRERQEELKKWITASKNDYRHWEGCRRLLIMLREKTGDKHLPDELLQWALDFACEHIEKPTLPQGHHETDNTIRDELIQFVIDMCHMGCSDMTLERTKEEVSNVVHLSYDTIDHIYKEQKRKKAARVKRVDEFIANAENKEIPTDP